MKKTLFALLVVLLCLPGCMKELRVHRDQDQDIVAGGLVLGCGFLFLRVDDDQGQGLEIKAEPIMGPEEE